MQRIILDSLNQLKTKVEDYCNAKTKNMTGSDLIDRYELEMVRMKSMIDKVMTQVLFHQVGKDFPVIVCLCGSTRFSREYQKANLTETLKGKIVLTIGCDMRSDVELFKEADEVKLARIKNKLDTLHLRKIDLADEVLFLNVDGYLGESSLRELQYARDNNKIIRFLESDKANYE